MFNGPATAGPKSYKMANIRTGSIVADIRGKVGSEVYSRNRGGAYVKTFVPPTNPDSSRQQANRTNFRIANEEWLALSENDKIRWEQYAANSLRPNSLGEKKNQTGRDLYLSRWMTSIQFDDQRPDYPEPPNNLDKLSFSVSITSTPAINYTVSFPHSNYEWGIIVYLSLPVNSAVRSINSVRTSRVNVLYYDTSVSSNFYSLYSSLWGAVSFTIGDFIWLRSKSVHLLSGFTYDLGIQKIIIT